MPVVKGVLFILSSGPAWQWAANFVSTYLYCFEYRLKPVNQHG